MIIVSYDNLIENEGSSVGFWECLTRSSFPGLSGLFFLAVPGSWWLVLSQNELGTVVSIDWSVFVGMTPMILVAVGHKPVCRFFGLSFVGMDVIDVR